MSELGDRLAAEDAEPNHVTELDLWRQATNFPACEPVGLGVAARKAYPGLAVDVHLDTDQPVLLEEFPEDFMTGFVLSRDNVWGRPVGVAVAKDGSLIVSEDASGTVWRIVYKGGQPQGASTRN